MGPLFKAVKNDEPYIAIPENRNENEYIKNPLVVNASKSGLYPTNSFDIGTARLYEQLYYLISEGRPMTVTPEMAAAVISVIEAVHATNPLSLKY